MQVLLPFDRHMSAVSSQAPIQMEKHLELGTWEHDPAAPSSRVSVPVQGTAAPWQPVEPPDPESAGRFPRFIQFTEIHSQPPSVSSQVIFSLDTNAKAILIFIWPGNRLPQQKTTERLRNTLWAIALKFGIVSGDKLHRKVRDRPTKTSKGGKIANAPATRIHGRRPGQRGFSIP